MSLILSIETATPVCSVSLHENKGLMGAFDLFIEKSHSEFLASMIEDLFKYARKEMKELSAVAISKGPGSYTGLRIGTSTAKGICFALDLPLIAINTLESMASQVQKYYPEDFLLCPMLDARRMEVYCMLLDNKLGVVQSTRAMVIDETSFQEILKDRRIVFFGNGMEKTRKLLGKSANAFFVEDIYPKADTAGIIALNKFEKQEFENLITFEPFYLKDFIAGIPKKMI